MHLFKDKLSTYEAGLLTKRIVMSSLVLSSESYTVTVKYPMRVMHSSECKHVAREFLVRSRQKEAHKKKRNTKT